MTRDEAIEAAARALLALKPQIPAPAAADAQAA